MDNTNDNKQGFKFCSHCGAKLAADAVFCQHCGARLVKDDQEQATAQQTATEQNNPKEQPHPAPQATQQVTSQPASSDDRNNAGFDLLGFLFPLIGLILYLVWKDDKPIRAKNIGKWALISCILQFILGFIYGIAISI